MRNGGSPKQSCISPEKPVNITSKQPLGANHRYVCSTKMFSCKYLERFADIFYLSRNVNVIHVTINIPFNDKSSPEKELLLQHSGKAVTLYQSPSYINLSVQQYKETPLIYINISINITNIYLHCMSAISLDISENIDLSLIQLWAIQLEKNKQTVFLPVKVFLS